MLDKLKQICKKYKFVILLHAFIVEILGYIKRSFILLHSAFPIRNKIMFISYYGKGIECNPKYIYEEIVRRKLNMSIYWGISNHENVNQANQNIHFVKYKSFLFYYHLMTSKFWISNVRLPFYWPKRKEQKYIQTWHGGLGIKKVEADVAEKLSPVYVMNAKHDSEIADLMLSNSQWLTNLYKNSFWYNGEILESGLPREDIFTLPCIDIRKKVYQYYQIEEKTKIVLYAPTFRENGNCDCYNIDFERLLSTLREKTSSDWKIILRLHPNIRNKSNLFQYNNEILDGSQYLEINELIIASDMVISDYSSCMFDAMLAGKIVVLYASDICDYNKDRGTYIKFEDLPFPLAIDNDSLNSIIVNYDTSKKDILYKKFLKEKGFYKMGQASSQVVDWIEKQCKV